MNPLVKAVRRAAHFAWSLRVRTSLNQEDSCRLFGLDLVIAPGVLHPRHFASSRFLARQLMSMDLLGRKVADIGTGSGLLALLAARGGATVTAVDISPLAVACASRNAERNGLAGRIEFAVSDVFDRVPAESRFDLVITNPPFYPREAAGPSDRAFAAGNENSFFARLSEALPERLARDGALVLIQSSDADFAPISLMFEARGMRESVLRERRGVFERLTIREFKTPTSY